MAEIETVLQAVPALGVIVALLYYTITIRNTEKMRRKDFIFQSNLARTPEFFDIFNIVMKMWDYETREEYDAKFSEEHRSRHNYLYNWFNVIGMVYKQGIASADEVFQLYPPNVVISLFELSWPLIRDVRGVSHNAGWLMPFESLYTAAKVRLPDYVPGWQISISTSRPLHP